MPKRRKPPLARPSLVCPRCSSTQVKGVLRDEPVGYVQCRVCGFLWSVALSTLAGIRWDGIHRKPR